MKARLVIAALAVVLVSGACRGDDDNAASDSTKPATKSVTLVLNWTPNTHHIGIYAAQQLGWYRDAGIDLQIVEPTESGAEQAVGAGKAQFGISVGEAVLPARAEGVPIVSIGAILPVDDTALMSLPEDGVKTPADLAGKTYGGYGGPLETNLIDRLATCGGAPVDTVEHVEVGNVDYLAGLQAGRFDFVWVFAGWDALRATEVEDTPVDLLRFADNFDCIPNWYTPLFISNEATIANDPELVRTFLEVTARGYDLAVDDPQRAADLMMKEVPETDSTLLHASADYYATRFTVDGEPFGTQDRQTWADFQQFLETANLLDEPLVIDKVFTNEFLPR